MNARLDGAANNAPTFHGQMGTSVNEDTVSDIDGLEGCDDVDDAFSLPLSSIESPF